MEAVDLADLEHEVERLRMRVHELETHVTRLLFAAEQEAPKIHWLERLAWMALGALGLVGWLRK